MEFDLKEALEHYKKMGAPADQSALVGLLKEVQGAFGGVPSYLLPQIAAHYGIKEALLTALIRRIPSLRLADTHLLEVCAGPNCPKRAKLLEFAEKTYGKRPGLTIRAVPCMRMCGAGPNIRFDGQIHHGADEALIRQLVEGC